MKNKLLLVCLLSVVPVVSCIGMEVVIRGASGGDTGKSEERVREVMEDLYKKMKDEGLVPENKIVRGFLNTDLKLWCRLSELPRLGMHVWQNGIYQKRGIYQNGLRDQFEFDTTKVEVIGLINTKIAEKQDAEEKAALSQLLTCVVGYTPEKLEKRFHDECQATPCCFISSE